MTIKEMAKYEGDKNVLFILTDADAQIMAKERIGRELTEDELYSVRKGLEWGLECWNEVMSVAIDEAVRNNAKEKSHAKR